MVTLYLPEAWKYRVVAVVSLTRYLTYDTATTSKSELARSGFGNCPRGGARLPHGRR